MPIKIFELPDIGTVRVTKRRDSRSLRISISANGEVRVSIPSWTPYQSGVAFAQSKSEWILSNLPPLQTPLMDGQRIGKAHRLTFATSASDTPSTRLSGSEIRVTRPLGMAAGHPDVQKTARRACIRALRSEAEALLPQRLQTLAEKFDFKYHSVSIKQLKGRWGSCDSKQNIVFNLFLMQLPWQLIDYVIVHELVHTKHLNHGAEFWEEFMRHEPQAKQLRKMIKQHRPVLEPLS